MARSNDLKRDNQAKPDELGTDPGQVGPQSAGQAGGAQRLSREADFSEESVEELSDTDQAWEAAVVDGAEDAADHPERPVHTHLEYGDPNDVPPSNPVANQFPEPPQAHPVRKSKPKRGAA